MTVAGEEYAIADIGMRMLQPHELYAAQGFPEENLLTEKSRKIWLHWKQTASDKDDWIPPPEAEWFANLNTPEDWARRQPLSASPGVAR